MTITTFFAPDHERYEGVRPVQIWLLRLFYLLMAAFVATDAWHSLLTHTGAWDPTEAVAMCVWATYPTLALLGIAHPLRMLPLMMFTIGYKTLWLIFVAWPLWRTGTLAGSPSEELANVFLGTPILVAIVPWGYVYRTYVKWPSRTPARVTRQA